MQHDLPNAEKATLRRSKGWKQEEIEYLENSWGQTSITAIAKHLGKSINAIKLKARRIGLRRHIHSGTMITLNQFCVALGKKNSYSQVKNRWGRAGLPIHYQKSIKKRYAMIDIDEFWEWAKDNKDLVDFNAFPAGTFGAEPEWVKEARHADFVGRMKRSAWTPDEDKRLKMMLKQYRYTYDEISTQLNRSEGAIKRRMTDLKLAERPVRRENRSWSENEIKTLIQMRQGGHGWEEIGRTLGRSGCAVRGKYERLLNPDYSKQYYRRQRENTKDCFQRLQCTHYVKTEGCRLHHTDCDICGDFCRRKQDEKVDTGWTSIRDIKPEQILK